jgi:hypothetical protein
MNSHFGKELWWTPEFSKGDFRGQNSLDWRGPYIIEKILEVDVYNGLAWPIWVFKTRVMAKQRAGSQFDNCQFDSRPLKVNNFHDFLACRLRVSYHWRYFDEGYNFDLDFTLIWVFHAKLWASKVTRVLISGFWDAKWGSWNKMTFECWSHG